MDTTIIILLVILILVVVFFGYQSLARPANTQNTPTTLPRQYSGGGCGR